MPTNKTRVGFFNSEEAQDVTRKLQDMVASGLYNTTPGYTANGLKYPNHLLPFIDKHLNYLNAHPKLDARMYLANLRLATRAR